MQNSEVQCVYWSHGRFDSDLQDHVFDEVMPSFFTDGDARNFLGIESAGTFTDQERDNYLKRAGLDPVGNLISDRIDGVTDSVRTRLGCLAQNVLADRSTGCLLGRESFLLIKWNSENPGRVVLPYHESYPIAGIRDEIERRGDTLFGNFDFNRDGSLFWRDLVDIGRRRVEESVKFITERDDNWLRILTDLTLKSEQNRTRFKILVTLGRWHFGLSEKLRRDLSDKLIIHDDIILPDSSSNGGTGYDWLVDKRLRGKDSSDEDYLRAIYFNSLVGCYLDVCSQDRTGFYAVDRAKLVDMWRYFKRMPILEIASSFDLTVDGSESTEYVPVEDLAEGSAFHGEDPDNPSLLIDRRNHPNNLWLDRQCVLDLLCHVMGITDSDKEVICLLEQCIAKMSPKILRALRREACEVVTTEDRHLSVYVSGFIGAIASASKEARVALWKDTGKKNGAVGRLVGLARAVIKRGGAEL